MDWNRQHLASDVSKKNGSLTQGYELSDVNPKGILGFGVFLFLGAIVMFLSMGFLFFTLMGAFTHTQTQSISERQSPRHLPSQPRLQTHAALDAQRYLEGENHLLSTYGWIDRKAGVARIPIQTAMSLLEAKSKLKTSSGSSND